LSPLSAEIGRKEVREEPFRAAINSGGLGPFREHGGALDAVAENTVARDNVQDKNAATWRVAALIFPTSVRELAGALVCTLFVTVSVASREARAIDFSVIAEA
jgi:hypothetical protein